jgi:hypothetical protein
MAQAAKEISCLRMQDEENINITHCRLVFITGLGFFTDAYDLFVIGVVTAILTPIWSPISRDIGCNWKNRGISRGIILSCYSRKIRVGSNNVMRFDDFNMRCRHYYANT